MPRHADATFEVEIDGMAHGGSGIGRHRGSTVFVPYTIPGERVLARAEQTVNHVTYASGVRLLDASGDRVYPRCPHFGPGRCWGCQWQHIDYAAQLLLKQDVLVDQLERLGGIRDDVVQPVLPSPSQWGYNHHMTFSLGSTGKLSLAAALEHTLVEIDVCHVLHPKLLELYEQIDLPAQGLRRVKLQIGTDDAPMLILYLDTEDAPDLETDLQTSVNLILPDNEPVNLVGDSHSRYRVHDRTLRVTAGSAYRANALQVPRLASTVIDLLAPQDSEYILDLFAGVGVFSAFLADKARVVTSVESFPPAVTDAETNLAPFDNVDVIEGAVEDVLAALDGHYDAAVVDPSGALSDEALAGIVDLGVQRLVYVSSDAGRLARDCKKLAKSGYRLMQAQPIDFAPHTYHVDTVALFVRSGRQVG